jgi:hypothetical protein
MLTRVAVAISVLCLVLPVAAFAQGFNQGDKEVLLNAAGVSENDFDNNVFSIEGSFGYFLTKNIEGAIRQSLNFVSTENVGSSWNANTRGALDYHFDMGRFWPFVGANLGYIYGDDVSDSWTVGIEGGVKFFVNATTFIAGRVEYDWLLNSSDDSSFSDATWVYVIGIGFRW